VSLPIQPPYLPMEAQQVAKLPRGEEWQYEPKWDGFRCIVFRDGDNVELQSKSAKPLTRYFPEVVAAMLELYPRGADAEVGAEVGVDAGAGAGAQRQVRFVLDGEIVVPAGNALSFEDLLQRIHPAESRVRKLSVETPARFIAFDLLVDAHGKLLVDEPLATRRPALEQFAEAFTDPAKIQLSPATQDYETAQEWLTSLKTGFDGVVAKRLDLPYTTGERTGMKKIKRLRTADCVVGGFRYASKGKQVGSLLLGLYDDDGLLHHVGFTSSFKANEKQAVTEMLEPLAGGEGFSGRAPGGPSRWSTERSAQWIPLQPKLVVEVQYDHFSEGRFRHGTKLLRWRPDKEPRACTMGQVAPRAAR